MPNKPLPTVSAVIVTHNSELYIRKALESLFSQTVALTQIVIVDSGSKDPSYLYPFKSNKRFVTLFEKENIGYCKGNNIGIGAVPADHDYILLLNPDAFLEPESIAKALSYMEKAENRECALLTGTVFGYDMLANKPTGKYDTTGVYQKWYGRWYDRGQGEEISSEKYRQGENVPAVCGALMFCRKNALMDVRIRDNEVLDNSFYMYKEDIDLCLRLRRKGWTLAFVPEVSAFHCRGWDRQKMARNMRILSAKNELFLHWRARSILGIPYSLLKYALVALFDL